MEKHISTDPQTFIEETLITLSIQVFAAAQNFFWYGNIPGHARVFFYNLKSHRTEHLCDARSELVVVCRQHCRPQHCNGHVHRPF